MKRYFIPLTALALLASCTTEVLNQDTDVISHVTITANDFKMDADTRTSLELTSSGLSFTWAESDVIGIYPNEGDQVSFPMTSGAGAKTADFNGGGWALKGSSSYAAYFPYNVDNTTFSRPYTSLPISYRGQSQPENGSTAGLGAYDYMVATASTPSSGNVTFNFSHISSVLYIRLTTPETATFSKLKLSVGEEDEEIFTTDAFMDISDATLTPMVKDREAVLNLNNITVEADGTLYAWMLIAPVDATGHTLTATLTTPDFKTYTAELAGKNFLTGRAYQLTGSVVPSEGGFSGTGGTGEDFGWGDDNELHGHAYVDLGFSSGTLWATMNIGASSPEEYGDHFAWGETWTKSEYTWKNYKWCNGTNNSFTKYNGDPYFGKVDNKYVLDLEDDAAHVNWGEGWRTPTVDELRELVDNCTWVWTTLNGVNGALVTSKINGKALFFPAAGRFGDIWTDYGGQASYATSSIYGVSAWGPRNGISAWYLHFDDWLNTADDIKGDIYEVTRFSGLSVRPVCNATFSYNAIAPMTDEGDWSGRVNYNTQSGTEWASPDYDDSDWAVEDAAWGTSEMYPRVKNEWTNEFGEESELYVRRVVTLSAADLHRDLWVLFNCDDDIELYVNGTLAVSNGITDSQVVKRRVNSSLFNVGENVIAVHCHNIGGPAYLDFGLYYGISSNP